MQQLVALHREPSFPPASWNVLSHQTGQRSPTWLHWDPPALATQSPVRLWSLYGAEVSLALPGNGCVSVFRACTCLAPPRNDVSPLRVKACSACASKYNSTCLSVEQGPVQPPWEPICASLCPVPLLQKQTGHTIRHLP